MQRQKVKDVTRGVVFACAVFGCTATAPDSGPAWVIVIPSMIVLGLFAYFNR